MARTHYHVLGIERPTSTTEVEAAFRELLAQFEARTYAGPDRIEDVREAYRVLANPAQRALYDETLPLERAPRTGAPRLGALKLALPVAVAVALGAWLLWPRAPREAVMSVGPVTRVTTASDADDDPTRPAPVTIPPAAPLEATPAAVPVAALAPGARGNAEEVFALAAPSVARVLAKDNAGRPVSQGSGVVVAPGTVVTNCHVTREGAEVTIKIGRNEHRATLATADEPHDLCHFSVAGLDAPPVSIGSVAQLRTGQRVFAIGAPQGLELTISEGIVSSLRPLSDGTMIQTSAPISPGSSGGGLFDGTGKLVGIVTFQHKFGQNLNFAVPADWVSQAR